MKTGLVIAALAAALITGSAVSSQAIPAAPLSKSIQQNSSLVETVRYRGYRGYRGVGRVGVYRGYRGAGLYRGYRGYRRVGLYRGYRGVGNYGYRGYRRAGIYGYRGYRGYRWGGAALYRNRGCW
jgi:hypothetical protein